MKCGNVKRKSKSPFSCSVQFSRRLRGRFCCFYSHNALAYVLERGVTYKKSYYSKNNPTSPAKTRLTGSSSSQRGSGATWQSLAIKNIKKLRVPRPPAPEQQLSHRVGAAQLGKVLRAVRELGWLQVLLSPSSQTARSIL